MSEQQPPTVAYETIDKGLKPNAIGYMSNVVIGVASTAPAYSMATTLGFVVAVLYAAGVGVHAPAIILVAFIPMCCSSRAQQILQPRRPRRGHHLRLGDAPFGPMTGW